MGTAWSEFIIYQEVARFCHSLTIWLQENLCSSLWLSLQPDFLEKKKKNTMVPLFEGLNKNWYERPYKNPMYEQEVHMYEYK